MTTRPVILPASARSHLAFAPRQAWLKDVDLKSHNIVRRTRSPNSARQVAEIRTDRLLMDYP